MSRVQFANSYPMKPTARGPLVAMLATVLLVSAGAVQAASVAWAGAESGFDGRTIDVYTAEQTNGSMTAQASIGQASIFGHTITDKIPSYAHSRTDFTVHGVTTNTPLTFNFQVQGSYQFVGQDTHGVGAHSGAWTAFVEAGLPHPSGGSFSMFGNLVVQTIGGQAGNPTTIVQCNGNTRGQDFCGQRRDFSVAQILTVSGFASQGTAGWVTEQLTSAGLNADMSITAYLVSVTLPDAIYFADAPQATTFARSFARSGGAYLEWGDGSRFDITLANGGGGNQVPEPSSLALMALGLLGCMRRWHSEPRTEA